MPPKTLHRSNLYVVRRLYTIIWLTITFATTAEGQWNDNFSQNSLVGWGGDTLDFEINEEERLQLNAPEGKSASRLFRNISSDPDLSFSLDFILDFDPSGSNRLELQFCTDTLGSDSNFGYGINVGSAGSEDAIEFYRYDNGVKTLLFEGPEGAVAEGPVALSMLFTVSESGEWYCTLNNGLEEVGSITDLIYPPDNLKWFILICHYSSTRRDKFQFDNFISGAGPIDTMDITLSLSIPDDHTLALKSNIKLDTSWLREYSPFGISPDFLPYSIFIHSLDSLTLEYASSFDPTITYSLECDSIKTLDGRILFPSPLSFSYSHDTSFKKGDIIVSELMFDPTPMVWLPESEYIELYNRTGKDVELKKWTLKVGNTVRSIPDATIKKDDFILLCPSEIKTEFDDSINTIGISSFPSLSNSGAEISLISAEDRTIHSFIYSPQLHTDPARSDGGYSIELKTPHDLCDPLSAWHTTHSVIGGTPGFINSMWGLSQDTIGPFVRRIAAIGEHSILIEFNEEVDVEMMSSSSNYSFSNILTIDTVRFLSPTKLLIQTFEAIQEGVLYSMLPFNAWDCLQNLSTIDSLPEIHRVSQIKSGDLVINEILFDPLSGMSRFVEIYNATGYTFHLDEIGFANVSINEPIESCSANTILLPGDYLVFAENKREVLKHYNAPFHDRIIECSLPGFDSKTDFVGMIYEGIVIDSFTYTADWHHPAISNIEGVSLERNNPESLSQLRSTWNSCSDLLKGTPGRKNSNALPETNVVTEKPILENSVFSPDNDGFDDRLVIHFPEKTLGLNYNAWIMDTDGRDIVQLANNQFSGPDNPLIWDGLDEEGKIARMGIYIAFIQFWSTDGEVFAFRLPCALVKR